MSTRDTPEIATTFGALDSSGFVDGMAVDAHHCREFTRNGNHLLAKEEQLFSLMVPRQEGDSVFSGDDQSPNYLIWTDAIRSWVPSSHWMKIVAPFPVAKKPGLHRAEARVFARISGSHTVYLQIATKGRPFDRNAGPSSPNVITLLGDGDDDVDSYTKTGMWIDPGGYEDIQLYVKGLPTGDQAPASGGDPNARSDYPSADFQYDYDNIFDYQNVGTWASPGWSRTGAEVVFYNADASVITRRIVTAVTEQRQLFFAPRLSDHELRQVRGGDDWAIFALPTIGLVSVSMAAEARTV